MPCFSHVIRSLFSLEAKIFIKIAIRKSNYESTSNLKGPMDLYLQQRFSVTRQPCLWRWSLRRWPETPEVGEGSWRAQLLRPGVWKIQAAQPGPAELRLRHKSCPSRRESARIGFAPHPTPRQLSTAFWLSSGGAGKAKIESNDPSTSQLSVNMCHPSTLYCNGLEIQHKGPSYRRCSSYPEIQRYRSNILKNAIG